MRILLDTLQILLYSKNSSEKGEAQNEKPDSTLQQKTNHDESHL